MALADVIHIPEQRAVQVEDGFTRIAHGILEALALADLGKRHYKVLMVLLRQTYGYNKKADEISLTQFRDKTGVLPPNVSTAIDELVEMRVVIRTPGKHAFCLAVNKSYGQWAGKAKVDVSKLWGYRNDNSAVIETISEGYQNDNDGVIESITTIDNAKRKDQKTTPKETLSRSLRERFEIFWTAYPRKRSKKAAEKAFAKVNPDEQLFNDLMKGLERAKTSEQWQNPQYQPHAGTWLNDGGWMDEFQTAYDNAELAVIRAFNQALGERVGTVDEAAFVEARAGAIRAFLGKLAADPQAWTRYFPAVRDKVELPPHAGFDYLISPKGYGDVRGRMAIKRTPDGTRVHAGDWDKSASGIKAKAEEMGIAFDEEEPVPAIAARVRAAIAKQEEQ
ncbi:replication protein [Caballeronia sp. LZ062]|uniref:replication protein n=1 Tax=unclassified Caballeronia TaxID=2646786 RepID=UPI00285605CE|nr:MULTISPECIES: replication protein [unclassified Caballeronia]MDR5856628.1 replication protein [Caballeronia sp. LZ050]MDR5868786.1 replication protein [Caballeronia sp. LZ062]